MAVNPTCTEPEEVGARLAGLSAQIHPNQWPNAKGMFTNVSKLFSFNIYLAAPGVSCSMRDLVPWWGIKPGCPALEVRSLNWTATSPNNQTTKQLCDKILQQEPWKLWWKRKRSWVWSWKSGLAWPVTCSMVTILMTHLSRPQFLHL